MLCYEEMYLSAGNRYPCLQRQLFCQNVCRSVDACPKAIWNPHGADFVRLAPLSVVQENALNMYGR